VKLIALDIDGTLIAPAHYGDGSMPGPELTSTIRRAVDSGVMVVLASGRMFPGTARVARHLGLPGPVICQQGCSVHLLDGTITHEFPIDRQIAMEIVDYAKKTGRHYEWFNALRYVVSGRTESAIHYGAVSGIEPEYRHDPENSGIVPSAVGVLSTADEASGVHAQLSAHYGEALHLLDFPDATVAVSPEANKGHALSLPCAELGIGRSEVVAIGDSVNDVAMLEWAGLGLAMAHSDQYALDAADDVLEDGDNTLVSCLERLLR